MNILRSRAKASAPAKVILFGEHFVVYGKPALLAAINKRIYVDVRVRDDQQISIKADIFEGKITLDRIQEIKYERFSNMAQPVFVAAYDAMKEFDASSGLDIYIKGEFPFGSGLGSSASTSVATVAAVSSLFGGLEKERIFELSLNAERLVHSNPSGADSAICTYGGIMLFREGMREMIRKDLSKLKLLIINSGIQRVTGDMVSRVRAFREKDLELFEELAGTSEKITMDAVRAIESDDYASLGSLMTLNHSLLKKINVSSDVLDMIVDRALKNGALGAKLTGAGGGGCVVALVRDNMKSLEGYDAFIADIDEKGVQIE